MEEEKVKLGYAPPSKDDGVKGKGMCALSVVFVVMGVTSILAGLIIGLASYTVYDRYGYGIAMSHNYTMLWMCILCGVTVGCFNFAFAVIVDACQKYRKTHKV